MAEAIADVATLVEHPPGAIILAEGSADNHILFILAGQVSVTIKGREVNRRGPGDHVGEMAAIDPAERRSASVVATATVVAATVQEAAFASIVEKHPYVLKSIAIELAQRLRQRTELIAVRREKPTLFIGSSVEGLPAAQALQAALRNDQLMVTVWTDGVFRASHASIESLELAVHSTDFAALVLSPDDKVLARGQEHQAPRDNVIFELGLFMGALGRERTFVVRPGGIDLKIPTDLLGLTDIRYAAGTDADLPQRIGPAATDLRRVIAKLGPR